MDLGLKDHVVFIAGASRGIGLATALGFASEGCKVAITGRGPEALANAQAELVKTTGEGRAIALQADMSTQAGIRHAWDVTEQKLGTPFGVVANVGSGTGQPGFAHLDREVWQAALDVNLLSGVMLADITLPRLVKQGRGSLCFVSSIAGMEALQAPIPYSAAKAGLMAAMKSYAREAGKAGVRVNAIAPGNVLFDGGSWAGKLENAEKRPVIEAYIRQEVALQRFASPQEIADVIVYMTSEKASFMSGSTVVVDGGQTRFVF